ncbi:hypothetical protein AB1E18_000462 [Capra hircus]
MHHRFLFSRNRLQRFVAFQTAAGAGQRHRFGPELLATARRLAVRPRQAGQHRSRSLRFRADTVPFWKGSGGSQWTAPQQICGKRSSCEGKVGVGLEKGWLLLITLVPELGRRISPGPRAPHTNFCPASSTSARGSDLRSRSGARRAAGVAAGAAPPRGDDLATVALVLLRLGGRRLAARQRPSAPARHAKCLRRRAADCGGTVTPVCPSVHARHQDLETGLHQLTVVGL